MGLTPNPLHFKPLSFICYLVHPPATECGSIQHWKADPHGRTAGVGRVADSAQHFDGLQKAAMRSITQKAATLPIA